MKAGLEQVLVRAATELEVPGAAVAVVRAGEPVRVACWGAADVGAGRPVDEATGFRVGSITKTMTTLLVLRLVEEKAVGLDDPIGAHVDVRIRQPRGARPITVRDLLTHRSGIGEIASWRALRHPLWAVGGCDPSRRPGLRRLAAEGYRAEAAPGERWVYANPGFTLLGLMVENVRGHPFGEVLDDEVLRPSGMSSSSVDEDVASTLAVGYKGGTAGFRPVRRFGVATVFGGWGDRDH